MWNPFKRLEVIEYLLGLEDGYKLISTRLDRIEKRISALEKPKDI